MSDVVCVLVTASSPEEGRALATAVLEARLAACVKIIPAIESHYWWQGKRESSRECQLVMKTVASHVAGLISCVKQHHSYAVPEVIALPVIDANPDYLDWVRRETSL